MSKFESLVGNVMAGVLIVIFCLSILSSLFTLLFRDGRGLSFYGSRGEMYMTE